MANPQIKFYKVASMPTSNLQIGAVYFDTTLGTINIATSATTYDRFGYGFREVSLDNKVLTFTKANGEQISLDFNDVASAKALGELVEVVGEKLSAEDQVVKSVDTTADAGVALVHSADGKLSVSVAEGTVTENNEAVVLGGQVYAAVKAAKEELAGQISGKNVSAEGDTYVSATAKDNNVTVAATTKLSEAVAKAETAVQEVVTGATNGTIKVDGTEVAVFGLQDAAYATVQSLNDTAKGYADAVADAVKSYSIAAVTGEELAGLGTNVKEAYKLVDEDSVKAGEYIKIYKDSALQSVVLNEKQELVFTYLLADGSESVVPVSVASFLAESEFGNGLSVNSETGVVSVKIDATSDSFLTVGTDGIKLTGVQNAIDGLGDRVTELESTKETVASALQKEDIATGDTNGTIKVQDTDVAVKGLGSAAYTESTAYDAAGEAAKVLGTSDDTADTNTVYGVKAYVTTALT